MKIKEFLFTGFFAGYSPVAPGTMGSLVGLIIFFIEYVLFGEISWMVNIGVVVIMLYPSIKLGDAGEDFFGRKDPSEVVLDEMMGFWISMMFIPFNWKLAVLGFFIFRILDIIKPYPANKLQQLKGGLGIMIDDYIAGIYSCLILHGILFLIRHYGLNI